MVVKENVEYISNVLKIAGKVLTKTIIKNEKCKTSKVNIGIVKSAIYDDTSIICIDPQRQVVLVEMVIPSPSPHLLNIAIETILSILEDNFETKKAIIRTLEDNIDIDRISKYITPIECEYEKVASNYTVFNPLKWYASGGFKEPARFFSEHSSIKDSFLDAISDYSRFGVLHAYSLTVFSKDE